MKKESIYKNTNICLRNIDKERLIKLKVIYENLMIREHLNGKLKRIERRPNLSISEVIRQCIRYTFECFGGVLDNEKKME